MLRQRPGLLGQRTGAFPGLERLRARGIALQRTRRHALRDADQPEHVEDEVVGPPRRHSARAPRRRARR